MVFKMPIGYVKKRKRSTPVFRKHFEVSDCVSAQRQIHLSQTA